MNALRPELIKICLAEICITLAKSVRKGHRKKEQDTVNGEFWIVSVSDKVEKSVFGSTLEKESDVEISSDDDGHHNHFH